MSRLPYFQFQNSDIIASMSARKFLPEVKRNRLLSNWVRMREIGKQVRRRSRTKHPQLIVVTVATITATAFLSLGFDLNRLEDATNFETVEKPSHTAESSQSKALTESEAKQCDPEKFARKIEAANVSRGVSPVIVEYTASKIQQLGGVLLVHFVCERDKNGPEFLVRWEFAKAKWLLKEISRPPSR
jgi:hypothetical protein